MTGGETDDGHQPRRSTDSGDASVPQRNPNQRVGTAQPVTRSEESVKVIKVYLDGGPETADSVRMLTDEVSQIQEVRYCLKTLREQMAARQNGNIKKYPTNGYTVNNPTPVANGNNIYDDTNHDEGDDNQVQYLREETKRLYAQMKDMERRHREERERLQMESEEQRARLEAQSERLQRAETESAERGRRLEELQRLLGNMEAESGLLRDKMAADEAELLRLQADNGEGKEKEDRCGQLETEVAVLKEKIHHLDDMLKSQQRKVRHMIEQLQNSRTVLQERDRVIGDLEEKVAFLEAENREMQDHMEHFLAGRDPPPLKSAENKPVIIYSKPLMPSTHNNKSLPFIKVIEIKS
ncbi:tuftelin 1b isoform X2 [Hippocampus comes]|uniref:Tuftelin-like n=1 Tax=Hippocampus comes TaxID=109280 RepID=A0A3Q2XC21_HIPCM|nr:PREDICTED: tuftelin-like isoform X2 [Hippocampus comes]